MSLDTSKIYSVAVQAFDSLDATMPAFQVGLEWLPDRGAYAALWNSCPAPDVAAALPNGAGDSHAFFRVTPGALWESDIKCSLVSRDLHLLGAPPAWPRAPPA